MLYPTPDGYELWCFLRRRDLPSFVVSHSIKLLCPSISLRINDGVYIPRTFRRRFLWLLRPLNSEGLLFTLRLSQPEMRTPRCCLHRRPFCPTDKGSGRTRIRNNELFWLTFLGQKYLQRILLEWPTLSTFNCLNGPLANVRTSRCTGPFRLDVKKVTLHHRRSGE